VQGRGDGEASNRAVDVEKKHTATSGGWGFSPFGDRRSIHRTDAHAQTARPAAFKKLEVMNDEITTAAARLEP